MSVGIHYTFGRRGEVLVIGWREAGALPQPFEQHHEENIVVFPDHVEHRRLEMLELGMTKYAVHTEKFPAPAVDLDRFQEVFSRAYALNSFDVRAAIRWAIKGSITSQSVV